MLRFRVQRLQIAGRHYLLLPKLNSAQMRIVAERLERLGYAVALSSTLSARSGDRTIHVSPSGVCWSSADAGDALIPAIPELLSCPKEKISLTDFVALYLRAAESGGDHIVRILPRLESSALWDSLRASGECGLSPDERAVALYVIANAGGSCRLLTDFPGDAPTSRFVGRRRYFESTVGREEAEETLRAAGSHAPRNSYLPRDGLLRFDASTPLSDSGLERLLEGLDEWCFFSTG